MGGAWRGQTGDMAGLVEKNCWHTSPGTTAPSGVWSTFCLYYYNIGFITNFKILSSLEYLVAIYHLEKRSLASPASGNKGPLPEVTLYEGLKYNVKKKKRKKNNVKTAGGAVDSLIPIYLS